MYGAFVAWLNEFFKVKVSWAKRPHINVLVVSASTLKRARLKWTVFSTELHLSDPCCWHVSVTQPFQANKDQLLNKVGDWTRPAVASKLFNVLLETASIWILGPHYKVCLCMLTMQSLCYHVVSMYSTLPFWLWKVL